MKLKELISEGLTSRELLKKIRNSETGSIKIKIIKGTHKDKEFTITDEDQIWQEYIELGNNQPSFDYSEFKIIK